MSGTASFESLAAANTLLNSAGAYIASMSAVVLTDLMQPPLPPQKPPPSPPPPTPLMPPSTIDTTGSLQSTEPTIEEQQAQGTYTHIDPMPYSLHLPHHTLI